MKKIVCIFICIALVFSLSSCKFSSKKQEEQAKFEREKYVEVYIKKLELIGIIVDSSLIEDEKYSSEPWVVDRVQLPDSEIMISLDTLKERFHIYELEMGKEPELTAEDIIDLYISPNEEKQKKFDDFYRWRVNDSFREAKMRYFGLIRKADNLYRETYGKPFIDKDLEMYTADEKYALVKWGIENIEGNYYKQREEYLKKKEVEQTNQ